MQNNIIIDNQEKKRKIKILILGDSHIHIFSTINNPLLDIRICKRQSATAYSLMKPESKSNSYNFFRKFLRNEETPNMNHPEEIFFADMGIQPNYIGIMLGEVDYRSLVFKKDPSNYKNTLSKSVKSIEQFCNEYIYPLIAKDKILILAPTLPKSMEENWIKKYPNIDLKKTTEYALFYYRKLKEMANKEGFIYLDITEDIYDKNTGVAYEKYLQTINDKGVEDLWHLYNINNEISKFWEQKLEILL